MKIELGINNCWGSSRISRPYFAERIPQFVVRYGSQSIQTIRADAKLVATSLRTKRNGVSFVHLNIESPCWIFEQTVGYRKARDACADDCDFDELMFLQSRAE